MELKLRNGVYAVHFYDSTGKRVRKSCGTSDLTTAQLKAVQIVRDTLAAGDGLDALGNEARVSALGLITLGEMLRATWVSRWSAQDSARSIRLRIGRIVGDIGHLTWDQLTYKRLKEYGEGLTNANASTQVIAASPATRNRYMSLISTAMHEARRENGSLVLPEFPSWSEDNQKDRYLSDEEEQKILAFFQAMDLVGKDSRSDYDYMHALFVVLVDTGMRANEALSVLKRDRVFPTLALPEYVTLPHGTTKSGKGRSVPLTVRAKAAVQKLLAHPTHGTLSSLNAGKRWSNIMDRLGIEDVTLHTLRHTCASRLVQRGVDLYVVCSWLGHSSIKVTERYAHLAPKNVLSAVSVLEPPVAPDVAVTPVAHARPALRVINGGA